jgi:hypothetical protein
MKKIIAVVFALSLCGVCFADEFPDINPIEPVVVPASQEKSYDEQWLKLMVVRAANPAEKATISFHLIPYDGAGSVLTEPVKQNVIPDAFDLAEKDPQFAQAFGAVLVVINKYKDVDFSQPFEIDPTDYHVIQSVPEPTPEPEPNEPV